MKNKILVLAGLLALAGVHSPCEANDETSTEYVEIRSQCSDAISKIGHLRFNHSLTEEAQIELARIETNWKNHREFDPKELDEMASRAIELDPFNLKFYAHRSYSYKRSGKMNLCSKDRLMMWILSAAIVAEEGVDGKSAATPFRLVSQSEIFTFLARLRFFEHEMPKWKNGKCTIKIPIESKGERQTEELHFRVDRRGAGDENGVGLDAKAEFFDLANKLVEQLQKQRAIYSSKPDYDPDWLLDEGRSLAIRSSSTEGKLSEGERAATKYLLQNPIDLELYKIRTSYRERLLEGKSKIGERASFSLDMTIYWGLMCAVMNGKDGSESAPIRVVSISEQRAISNEFDLRKKSQLLRSDSTERLIYEKRGKEITLYFDVDPILKAREQ